MKYLIIIPARGGSKRLPNKNLINLDGKPLIQWTIDFAKKVEKGSHILVSTDSTDIAHIARKHEVLVPWLRPVELSSDTAKTADVCLHALNWFASNVEPVDCVVTMQPTSPFRSLETYFTARQLYEENFPNSVITVLEHTFTLSSLLFNSGLILNEIKTDLISELGNIAQEKLQSPSGNLYLTSADVLKNCRSLLGESIVTLCSKNKLEEVDIDTLRDYELAQILSSKSKQMTRKKNT
jgi:CMP-N,N'-diacetyllegionaminic acid synthase